MSDYPQSSQPSSKSYPQQPEGWPDEYGRINEEQVTTSDNVTINKPNKTFDFDDATVQKGFIRKVYSILMCQLLTVFIMMCCIRFSDEAIIWILLHPWALYLSWILTCVISFLICCFEDLRRKVPFNYIFLGIFTFFAGFSLGTTAIFFNPDELMLAVGLTVVICFSLTVFAFQTKWDFTVLGGILFVGSILIFVLTIVLFFWHGQMASLIYGAIGAVFFSVYLIYDTQMMMGGKHKYSISPEDYIYAALQLYIDIHNIFISILNIMDGFVDCFMDGVNYEF